MLRLRALGAVALSFMLACTPLLAAKNPTTTPLGTVIAAERAHVGKPART